MAAVEQANAPARASGFACWWWTTRWSSGAWSRMLSKQDPALEVVGAASNGAIALQRIPQLNPDVITLDIEMPEMDGLEMLRRVRRDYPQLRVIMFSTLTERGAAVTLEALTLGRRRLRGQGFQRRIARSLDGAPAGRTGPEDQAVLPHARGQAARDPASAGPASLGDAAGPVGAAIAASTKARPKVVVIGVSTGGPTALGAILPAVAGRVPVAGPGGAAHAAAVHPLARRASSLHLSAAGRRKRARATRSRRARS